MQYMIEIPKPSAKRLESIRKVVVSYENGWNPCPSQEYEVPVGDDIFVFERQHPLIMRNPHLIDGSYHEVTVEYSNTARTRSERIRVEAIEL